MVWTYVESITDGAFRLVGVPPNFRSESPQRMTWILGQSDVLKDTDQ
jgi:hypothetical protein